MNKESEIGFVIKKFDRDKYYIFKNGHFVCAHWFLDDVKKRLLKELDKEYGY